jgi:hypothetical protein
VSEDAKLIEALSEPFEAFKHLFDVTRLPPDRAKAANESLIADLVGDAPIAVPASPLEAPVTNLMYAILEISGPAVRFSIYKKMFQYYPWRNRISQADHLQSAYYLFAHECYILETRLKIFFRAIDSYARLRNIKIDINRIAREVLKVHRRTFDQALRWRGRHVHEEDFVPRDIKRIGLLEMMILGEKISPSKSRPIWRVLQKIAIKDIKKKWIVHCDGAGEAAHVIIALAFRLTKPVWQNLKNEGERI